MGRESVHRPPLQLGDLCDEKFDPIYDCVKAELLACSVIHADETVVRDLNEPSRKVKTESRMWVYCAGKYQQHANIRFDYTPT